jgi:hypothetical protein
MATYIVTYTFEVEATSPTFAAHVTLNQLLTHGATAHVEEYVRERHDQGDHTVAPPHFVPSENSEDVTYAVTPLTCTCSDYRYRGRRCKHMVREFGA